jgi:hypothetical protein
MSTVETQELRPTEQELVERWRSDELQRAGYPEELAERLAARPDVDLHRALDLVRDGCTPQLAADILL